MMATTKWLSADERAAWVRLSAVLELLPAALDAQLSADSHLTHFEYFTLAMLSEAPGRVLRMSDLAARTNATLPRLSRVITQLEKRKLVRRSRSPQDGRATNVTLTDEGWETLVAAAPGHVEAVRRFVFDVLDPRQVDQLAAIAAAMLSRLDPHGRMAANAGSTPSD